MLVALQGESSWKGGAWRGDIHRKNATSIGKKRKTVYDTETEAAAWSLHHNSIAMILNRVDFSFETPKARAHGLKPSL